MPSQIDYSTVAHEVMYRNVHTGPGPGVVDALAEEWQAIAVELLHISQDVARAVGSISDAHDGAAAEATRGAVMPLAPWAQDANQAAQQQAQRARVQAASFAQVLRTMPPPIPRAPLTVLDFGMALASPDPNALGAQNRASVAAEEQARALMTDYQEHTNSLVDGPVAFVDPPAVLAEIGPTGLREVGTGGAVGGGGGAVPQVSGAPAADPVQVAPQAAAPPAPAPPPAVAPVAAAGNVPGVGGGFVPRSEPARPVPVAPAGVLPPGGRGGGGGRAGGGRVGGFRGGPGPSGPPPTAGQPPGTAAGEALGRAASGRPGMPGAGMGGMTGAGRGRGGEDEEHQRPSYLIEQDENAIVGKLPPVAPPVIGQPEYDQDDK